MEDPTTSSRTPFVKRRIHDIKTYQLPRLSNFHGPQTLKIDLIDELKNDLNSIRTDLEFEGEVIESLEDDYDELQRKREELKNIESDYKKYIVISSTSLKSKYNQDRYELSNLDTTNSNNDISMLKDDYSVTQTKHTNGTGRDMIDGSQGERGDGLKRSDEDAVQTKNDEITDALRRTLGTMQVELEKSVMSVQMLDDSTKTLRSTSNLYDTYSIILQTSSTLVKALEKADWYDRLIILLAFTFFLLVVVWILKRRVLDKVTGGVGWWFGGSWKLIKMAVGGDEIKPERMEVIVNSSSLVLKESAKGVLQPLTVTAAGVASAASSVAVSLKGSPEVKFEQVIKQSTAEGMIQESLATEASARNGEASSSSRARDEL